MPLITFSMLWKISASIIANHGINQIKDFYQDKREDYEKELTAIIEETIKVFSQNFDTTDKNGKYSFTKSKVVLEHLLTFSLSKEYDTDTLFKLIKQQRNIYTPTNDELTYFIEVFESKLKSSEYLKDFHIKDNYPEEIFLLSEKLNNLLELNREIKNDTQEIKESMNVFLTLKERLHQNYHSQIEEIRKCAERFQVDTALSLIENLELELNTQNIHDKEIRGKLLFLKAHCIRETNPNELEFAKIFVEAYLVNPEDISIKREATVSYFNLEQKIKSIEVANEILAKKPFDITAWIIKTINNNDISGYLDEVPEVVKKSYGYPNSIAYFLLLKKKELNLEQLESIGLSPKIEYNSLPKLNLFTKDIWNVNIELLYNLENKFRRVNYVAGPEFFFKVNHYTENLVKILEEYIDKIDRTEIHSKINAYKWILNYYKYVISNDSTYAKELDKLFPNIKGDHLKLTQYCQVLNHQKRYNDSILEFSKFKNENEDFPLDILFFQINTLIVSGKERSALNEVELYIESVPVIDSSRIHNLKGILVSFIQKLNREDINSLIETILKKDFVDVTLKNLVEIEFDLVLNKDIVKEELLNTLKNLEKDATTENLHIFLHCYMLLSEKRLAKSLFEEKITDYKNSNNESLKLYAYNLLSMLKENNEESNNDVVHSVLIDLLKYCRKNFNPIDQGLLVNELELYKAIHDWENVLEISKILYSLNPEDEFGIHNYVIALVENKDLKELKIISEKIPKEYKDQIIAINISKALLNSKVNTEKGWEIAYSSARDAKSIQARQYYFSIALSDRTNFETFEEVRQDTFVEFSVDEERFIEYVDENHNWIGKKIGEIFTETESFSGALKSICIVQCFNKFVKLYKEILSESNNPLNKLGIKQFSFDTSSKEGMEKQLKSLFGFQGEEDEKLEKRFLNEYSSYQIGFFNITNTLFQQDFWTANKYLRTNHTFNTIPKVFYGNRKLPENAKFVLDFSSLCTMYDIDNEIGLPSTLNKFLIPNLFIRVIENLIKEEKESPESFRLKITTKNVIPNFKPEDFSKRKIDELEKILKWIEHRCEPVLIPEKIDFVFKLQANTSNILTQTLLDNILLSNRENHILITDDVFYLLNSGNGNLITSEIFFLSVYDDKTLQSIYGYYLKNNYVGITFPYQVIYDAFLKYISGKNNEYLLILKSLSQAFNPYENKISELTKFIKSIYLLSSVSLEKKNSHVHNVLIATFPGSETYFRNNFRFEIEQALKLTGHYYDEFIKTFDLAEMQFSKGLF